MPNIQKPDFTSAYLKANEILVKSSVISTFPFSAKALVKEQTNIPCRSYKKANKYGTELTAFGSESAIIMQYHGKSIIFYDETKPDAHISFSILHEMGHEILGHDFSKKDEKTYHNYEVETNYFTGDNHTNILHYHTYDERFSKNANGEFFRSQAHPLTKEMFEKYKKYFKGVKYD